MADHPPALVDHDNRAHALLSSSKAEIWTKCIGAAALWVSNPQPFRDSPEALEGRRVAAMVERCGKTGEELPDGYEAAQLYIDTIAAEAARYLDPVVEFENERIFPQLAKVNPHCGGTPDATVIDMCGEGFSVIDLKWGEGVSVPAEGNPQLLNYAYGVDALMRELGCAVPDTALVRLIIVMPRWRDEGKRVKVWEMSAEEFRRLARFQMTTAATIRYHLGAKTDLPRVPGDYCRWCPAAAICPEKRAQMLAAIPDDLEMQPTPPQDLTKAQIVRVLELAPLISKWLKDVKHYALTEALAGRLPGYKVVHGEAGDRAWAKGVAEGVVATAAKQMGVHPYAEPKLLSVAQMEVAIGKAVQEARGKGKRGNPAVVEERMANLAPYISRSPGRPTLALTTDKRAAFNPALNLPDDLGDD